jgi:dTMP kinase
MSSGVFVTIEGIEGSGKSTQARLLAAYLRSARLRVTETREPGGTEIGEMIRRILLSPSAKVLSPETELLLVLACRADHVERVIRPALGRSDVVCSDRYADATIVYQGFGRELDLKLVRKLNEVATGGLMPHLTLLLDLDVEVGLERVARRSGVSKTDRFEREALEFHKRVREGYRQVASEEPDRVKVVGADAPIDFVQEHIRAIVRQFLSQVGLWRGVERWVSK